MAVEIIQLLADLPVHIQAWLVVLVGAIAITADGKPQKLPLPSNRERYVLALSALIVMSLIVVLIENGVNGLITSMANRILTITIIGVILYGYLGLKRN